MTSQISNLKNQKIREESTLQTYYAQGAEYQLGYDNCLTTIGRLEQELNDLLFYKKHTLEESQNLESLIIGDASPMGKIHFHQTGLLEGRFLEKAQTKLLNQKRRQKQALATIENNIQEMKRKERQIEDELETERTKLLQFDDLISNNKANIESKKMAISTIESKIRSIS